MRPIDQVVPCGNRPVCTRTSGLKIADYQCQSPPDGEPVHRRASQDLAGITVQCPACAHYTQFYHPSEDATPSGQKSPK